MNIEGYKFKKGDIVNFIFTYPKNHVLCGPQKFKGTFKKYIIVDNNGFCFKFGPRNIKKNNIKYVMAEIEYINEYNIKILYHIRGEDFNTICLA